MKLKQLLSEKVDKTQEEYEDSVDWLQDIATWLDDGLADTEEALGKLEKELMSVGKKNKLAMEDTIYAKLVKDLPSLKREYHGVQMKLVKIVDAIKKMP